MDLELVELSQTGSHFVLLALLDCLFYAMAAVVVIDFGPIRFAKIYLTLMLMLICCERKTLFVR